MANGARKLVGGAQEWPLAMRAPKRPPRASLIRGHSVYLPRKTKLSLEDAFWKALKEIAAAKNRSVNDLVGQIEKRRPTNLSSAMRLFVLDYYRERAR